MEIAKQEQWQLVLLFRTLRSFVRRAVLLLLLPLGSALAEGSLVVVDGVEPGLARVAESSALPIVNELSNRRRLTTFFANEQSPFYGVQVNYVNVGRGNLTFLNRDLVRLDRMPIVAGRVYDSSLAGDSDFGPGWKLSVAEVINQHGNTLSYTDAAGSVYELSLEGTRIVSSHGHLTGVHGGQRSRDELAVSTSDLTKRFRNIRGAYYLSEVTDRFGNSLFLDYSGTRVSRISSQNGRYVDIERDDSGRIVAISDDAGRRVAYGYDASGQLMVVQDVGGSLWRYSYDVNGSLERVTDPRGIDVLAASYEEDGRVSAAKVLYDAMSFTYQGSTTSVQNGLQQSATFWSHESGLTDSIQDFEGSTTEVGFDVELKPVTLSFNGTTVATLHYDADYGNLESVRSSVPGRPETSVLHYDALGRLASVVADGEQVASYEYDGTGRLIRAEDPVALRSYEYLGDTTQRIDFNETVLELERNHLGLLTAFWNAHQAVSIHYNDLDQVGELRHLIGRDVYQARYRYEPSGLRSTGDYVLREDMQVGLSLDYDAVGNLTNLHVEAPDGARSSQTYVIGENNQLDRILNNRRADVVFEYDASGRPIRRSLGPNIASYEYDALGRLSSVYQGGQKVLTSEYGPMDVDVATEADDKTPLTAVDERIASAIFGSVDSIAYARIRGTPFGPIRFDATMARFVLPPQLVPSPDSVTVASLKRRQLPLSSHLGGGYGAAHASVDPGPLGFDKPSNALFLPAEFSSLNCYMCVSWIVGSGSISMKINGTGSGTASGTVGVSNFVEVTSSGTAQCWADVINYATGEMWTELGTYVHYLDFGNGFQEQKTSSGLNPSTTRSYTYNSPGLYSVTDSVACGCAGGMLIWDTLGQASRSVQVTYPPGTSVIPFDIRRHTTATFSAPVADGILASASLLLQKNHGSGDVACPIALQRNGPISTFTVGTGAINTQPQLDAVIAVPGRVKVVREINFCSGTAPSEDETITGCANRLGMILTRAPTLEDYHWAHEYAHNQDYWTGAHSTNSNSLGYGLAVPSARRISQSVCDGLRNPYPFPP